MNSNTSIYHSIQIDNANIRRNLGINHIQGKIRKQFNFCRSTKPLQCYQFRPITAENCSPDNTVSTITILLGIYRVKSQLF